MGDIISQRELRNESGRIMRALAEGRSFIVTRNSLPVGELRPFRGQHLVDTRRVTELFGGAPCVDATQFRADIDGVADQSLDALG